MRRLPRSAVSTAGLSAAAILLTARARPAAGALFGDYYWGYHSNGFNNCQAAQSSRRRTEEFVDGCLRCHGKNRCHWGDRPIEIPPTVIYAERLWAALLAFAGTLEVLVRGFTLGFGVRMLKYLFFEDDNGGSTNDSSGGDRTTTLRSFRRRAAASAVAGLSLAAFLHGSSVFVPAQLREEWFSHGVTSERAYDTSLPQSLYKHIRKNCVLHVTGLKVEGGDDLVCPSQCDGEDCDYTTADHPAVDWTDYVLGRVGTGLVCLVTTFEVLFRGFSLGFGARMLKFLFSRDSEKDGDRGRSVDSIESLRHRATVSALSGISTAASLHGASLFVPSQWRDRWFAEDRRANDRWEMDDGEALRVLTILGSALVASAIATWFLTACTARGWVNMGFISRGVFGIFRHLVISFISVIVVISAMLAILSWKI